MIDVFAGVIMAHYSYAVLSPYMYPFFDKIMISKHMRCQNPEDNYAAPLCSLPRDVPDDDHIVYDEEAKQ